jgi:predicted DsbA family dithiol-disulfide isomerase
MTQEQPVNIEVFSDVLCIWAYGAQARLDHLKRTFGERVTLIYRFIPLFGAARERIDRAWRDQGGFEGFNRHLRGVAAAWDHVRVHPELWLSVRPASSTPAHLVLKAAQALESCGAIPATRGEDPAGRTPVEAFAWRIREAFFAEGRDIARAEVLWDIVAESGLPVAGLQRIVETGEAHALLQIDAEARDHYLVPGSPTLVFNEGRQRLYGNVGYRIIEANIRELFRDARYGEASWC